MKKTFLFIGSVIILILAAVTFVFIPALAPKGVKELPPFGSYDGKAIELKQGTEFANAVANYTEWYKNQGQQINDYTYFSIYSYAFNSAVTAVAYKKNVEKSGYVPSTQEISRKMIPYFTDESGKFSAKLYNQVSEANRAALKKDIVNNLKFTRYYEDLFGSSDELAGNSFYGIKSSAKELSFLAENGSKKRTFDMVAFNKEDYPKSEIAKYGADHLELFNSYSLSVISVNDESQAKKLLSQLNNKEVTFEDAVSEYSEKFYSSNDGKLTSSYGYQIDQMVAKAENAAEIKALSKDVLSSAIQTTKGWSIFRGNGDVTSPDFTTDKMIDVVRKYMNSNEAGTIEDYYLSQAKDFAALAATSNFESAAKKFNVKSQAVPAFPMNYGNVSLYGTIPSSIKELGGASSNENFLKKAFALKNGDISEPVVVGNYIIVLRLSGEQTDAVTEETKTTYKNDLTGYDRTAAQTALLTSDKVKNNVSQVFFNNIMSKN